MTERELRELIDRTPEAASPTLLDKLGQAMYTKKIDIDPRVVATLTHLVGAVRLGKAIKLSDAKDSRAITFEPQGPIHESDLTLPYHVFNAALVHDLQTSRIDLGELVLKVATTVLLTGKNCTYAAENQIGQESTTGSLQQPVGVVVKFPQNRNPKETGQRERLGALVVGGFVLADNFGTALNIAAKLGIANYPQTYKAPNLSAPNNLVEARTNGESPPLIQVVPRAVDRSYSVA